MTDKLLACGGRGQEGGRLQGEMVLHIQLGHNRSLAGPWTG